MNKLNFILLLFIGFVGINSAHSQNDTSCINLKEINSVSDEYLPFLVDSTLFFTSNRKNTEEGQSLEFTEKVYWSAKKQGKWSLGKKQGYKWNSDNNTALIGLSPNSFFFNRSYWKDNGEIFSAKRKLDTANNWNANQLKKLSSICSEFDENSITAINDDTLYFISNRNGNYDIFIETNNNNIDSFPILNSPFSEQDLFITKDGNSLFFSSNRPGGKGGFDIYKTSKINNHWENPVLLQNKDINTEFDDRDFRFYNDSTMFISSNRKSSLGGFDIFLISTHQKDTIKPSLPIDTIQKIIAIDTIRMTFVIDTIIKVQDELVNQLKNLGLSTFSGEIQLGAFQTIPTVKQFKEKFKCIENLDIKLEIQKSNAAILNKFILNKIFTNIDEAIAVQKEIIKLKCLPDKDFFDVPFIGMLDKDGKRFAIFWEKHEFDDKEIFYIYSNGKQIWKGKRF